MENYIVSARKYRPSTFESVVGQRALTTTLKNAIATGKLAHAYLFCGPRGVGKTTCARIFAKTINCLNPTADGEACNQCESCVAFNEQRSYNIHELDAASNNSIEDIRQLIDQVRIPPQIGKYKVYIIDEVHMLSTSAFNAFLKTLEEPPHHAIFVLATTEKHKILPTILSRCQIYDFNRISVEDTVAHLSYVAAKEGVEAEPEALNVIALKADGGMRDALSIFDQVTSFTEGHITYAGAIDNLNVLDYEYYFRLTDCFLERRVGDALLLFNEVLNKGFDGSHFITGLSSHLRDLLVSRDQATLSLLEVGASIRERYKTQAVKCTAGFLYRAMKLCTDCELNYRVSKNRRLLVELTLIQVAQIDEGADSPSGGRSPKQIITPVFPQGAPTKSVTPVTTAPATESPVHTTVTESAPSNNAATILSKLTGLGGGTPQSSVKKRRMEDISIHGRETSSTETSTVRNNAQTTAVPQLGNRSFTELDLRLAWSDFIAQLPLEQTATAARMKNGKLTLLNNARFEIALDNELAAKPVKALASEAEAFLRSRLQNAQVKMQVRVCEQEEGTKFLTRPERYKQMTLINPDLERLRAAFDLELT